MRVGDMLIASSNPNAVVLLVKEDRSQEFSVVWLRDGMSARPKELISASGPVASTVFESLGYIVACNILDCLEKR